jgi:enoyl-[acyl-carrier protein] reductase II
MLRTRICEMLGIEHPIIQGPIGPAVSPELVAAVSNAGGLGSIPAVMRSGDQLRQFIDTVVERVEPGRPFAVNHLINSYDEEAFDVTLKAEPAVISFALGDPGERIKRACEAGAVVIQQVVTVAAAYRAAEAGVDIIIAQGTEAGGNTGLIGTLPLVPQVVDAVAPVPVVAAGGIADGRGLAAVLMLGAEGINMGTRFLAASESAAGAIWQAAVTGSRSDDIMKFPAWNLAMPPAEGDYFTIPSTVATPFTRAWQEAERQGGFDADELRERVTSAAVEGRLAELVPLAGQAVGLISSVRPAAEIIREIVAEAEAALARGGDMVPDGV